MPTHDQHRLYLLVNRLHYESFWAYSPRLEDFHDHVRALLPDSWILTRASSFWFLCKPKQASIRRQGWKIHLAATLTVAREVLLAAVPDLVDSETPFKFALDRQALFAMNGKNWDRHLSGKFVTAYPPDDATFVQLLSRLDAATRSFAGPCVLSDRPFRDSRVVSYRYGAFVDANHVTVDGTAAHVLAAPDGTLVPDRREPYFVMPHWLRDPVLAATEPAAAPPVREESHGEITLKNGTYRVTALLATGNCGGRYAARDADTGREVVIKEARPGISVGFDDVDAVGLLHREHRILRKLEQHRIAPAAFDLFKDWEHWFLVLEKLSGISLAEYVSRYSPVLLRSPSPETVRRYLCDFCAIFSRAAAIFDEIHAAGVVVVDVSPSNVMIDPDTLEIRVFDFEAACELGIDKPVGMMTPGFGPMIRWESPSWEPSTADDVYGLGALMLAHLFRINTMLPIHPRGPELFLSALERDFDLPRSIRPLILSLLSDRAESRPSLTQVRAALDEIRQALDAAQPRKAGRQSRAATPRSLTNAEICAGALAYIAAQADTTRTDRLFPADARVFHTNPLSIAYGACGIALAFQRASGDVPRFITDWIVNQLGDRSRYPPGLYIGSAGIAWTLLELGFREDAEAILRHTHHDSRVSDSPDLFTGLAGWGLANIRFFMETNDERYLEQAREAARRLDASSQHDEAGSRFWPRGSVQQLGLAHGSSGIALFYLYLYQLTKDERYLDVGRSALAFDLARASTRDGGLTWTRFTHGKHVVYPYWRYGSAGIGTVVARYFAVTRDGNYHDTLTQLASDVRRKYTVFCGHLTGLAGIGHCLLDLYGVLGDTSFLDDAHRLADGIELFCIRQDSGIAFPGEGGWRISCDYGTGSAGVVVFLDRLMHPSKSAPYLLDGLLELPAAPTLSCSSSPEADLRDAQGL